ncbi:CU044_5270 family protein [Streptomyces cylindrosporus]|uniref:CU044_5270 family protein n=1 Tax=Streptomyces cylindrosporus TaxID=2927583 RepID=A0ABS9YCE2_9ACTN|nr:CU044_5270 family protein [Streptomyces cylindrosporus]MCI3274903.1 CU044_5270 family protein [Streptomyces cylindrosporus]
MNPEEREEPALLLPSPGEPVLTDDRHDLLKTHLLRELTVTRRATPRRRFALIAVPVATAVVAAAVVVGVGRTGTPATDPRAVDLLNRIAAVAATRKAVAVRDDQYLYVRTQGFMKFSDKDVRTLRESSWTAVDGKRPGLRRITVLNGPPFRPRDPFSSYSKGTHDMRLSPDPNVTTFRELEALPTDPDALLRKIYDDTKDDRGQALERIGDMLAEAGLLPELDAALYRAAAKVPGVSVVANAKDYAGRSGIGLAFRGREEREVWVFDKESLAYLGSGTEALLDVGVADKAGETPEAPDD